MESFKKRITINGEEVKAGETKEISVNIARLPSGTSIDIIVFVYRSVEEGPSLLLTAGLHGDELNGVEVMRRMIDKKRFKPECGTIICIPIINIYGFIHFSRYVPDGKDINRSFPGNKNGSLASRIARFLMKEIVPHIDYGIDFHTGGASRSNYPQIRCVTSDPENMKLAESFQAPFTINSGLLAKTLRHASSKLNKNILVYEGGESLRLDENAIQIGVDGTRRVMKSLNMISHAPKPQYEPILLEKSTWVRSRFSGLFNTSLLAGSKVRKNQILGTINDPFGEFQHKVKAPHSGYLIGLNHNPLVHQGDALLHIGIKESA